MGIKYVTFNNGGDLLLRYDDAINIIPGDAIAVSDELFMRMLNESDGVWTRHSDGSIAKDPLPPLTADELGFNAQASMAVLLSSAFSELSPLQYAADLGIETDAERKKLTEWKTYCVELSRISSQPGYPESIAWPEPPVNE